MLSLPIDRLLNSLGETLVMTAVSGAISFAVGLPLGIILVGTSPGGLWENRWTNRVVGTVVNSFRSLPFIILLVALIPLTRLIPKLSKRDSEGGFPNRRVSDSRWRAQEVRHAHSTSG
jgi:D-methionine transport system permease protein